MAASLIDHYRTKNTQTPESQPIPGREDEMVKNAAGGYVFKTSAWEHLDRFLIMGTEGGTYYVGEKELTQENAKNVIACVKEDGVKVLNAIYEISDQGRAAKQDYLLYALAIVMSYGDLDAKRQAAVLLPKIARTASHLFMFVKYLTEGFRGWGRIPKRAVANWYTKKTPKDLSYQIVKYRNRSGYTHTDLLRLARPKSSASDFCVIDSLPSETNESLNVSNTVNEIFKYVKSKHKKQVLYIPEGTDKSLQYIRAFESMYKEDVTKEQIIDLINQHQFTHEAIPTEFLKEADVWRALLKNMPARALVTNLGRLSRLEILKPFSSETDDVHNKLTNEDYIKKSRIHPMNILTAISVYSSGKAEKGSTTWTPVPKVMEALEVAFELSFKNVIPTGKKILLGIDKSGSMTSNNCKSANGSMNLSAFHAAMSYASIIANTEDNVLPVLFDTGVYTLAHSLKNVPRTMLTQLPSDGGGTVIALPVAYALQEKINVDAIVILTDNETWAGARHTAETLTKYRKEINPNTKLIVLGFSSTSSTVVDPKDKLSLGISGLDSAGPSLISDFIKN